MSVERGTNPVDAGGHDATAADAEQTPETPETLETVVFALDGVTYEVDLSASGAAALRAALAPYVAHARPVRSRGERPTTPRAGTEQNRAIREWARRQGRPLGGRGRIPSSFVEDYHREQRQVVHTKFSPLATAIAHYRWTHGTR